MRILKVCTHPYGGATIAARRQAQALNDDGLQCAMVYIVDVAYTDRTRPWVERNERDFVIKVPGSLWGHHGRMTQALTEGNRTSISNTYFSFFPVRTSFDEQLLDVCRDFDIIHFHWIAGMVSQGFLAQLQGLGKKIVITSHDMNHFTGGCHYSAGCRKYAAACAECAQLMADPLRLVPESLARKTDGFAALDATWLFPSRWLERCFRASRIAPEARRIRVLHNCIDTARFLPLDGAERERNRSTIGFRADETVLVAGSVNNSEKRKGFRYLEAVVGRLSARLAGRGGPQRFAVVTFGQGKPELNTGSGPIRHVHLGVVEEAQIISIFQSADLFLMPSIEENFANTILESLHCGCPVLAFRIGGVPDIVEHEVNGWIVDDVTEDAYEAGLARALDDPVLRDLRERTLAWRRDNEERFSPHEIARQLKDCYENTSVSPKPEKAAHGRKAATAGLIYERLFGLCAPNNVYSHQVTASNLRRHVARAQPRLQTRTMDRPLEIPVILKGFTEWSSPPGQGFAGWQLQTSSVMFPFERGRTPALCIQYPNRQDSGQRLHQIAGRLEVRVNGHRIAGHWIQPRDDAAFGYLWILPGPEVLEVNEYNLISFDFAAPTVPMTADPRGLCARFTAVNLYDLDALDGDRPLGETPDFRLSTALSLRGGTNQYLWESCSAEDYASHSVGNDLLRWRDLLGGNT